jgi:hypothetical protein
MSNAKLKFDGKEIALDKAVSTLGRASDNTVACINDANVSRYHAEIEERDGEYWLIELGSSNGTTVNGEDFETEKLLKDGDVILLGGSSKVEFLFEKESAEKDEAEKISAGASPNVGATSAKEKTEAAEAAPAAAKFPWILGVMGAVVGLAIVSVAAVVLFSYFRATPKCEATAKITKPESQDTITQSTDVEIVLENGDCVTRAYFLLNGDVFASADEQPFQATLDPKQFPGLADGSLQNLQIVLEDAEGNKLVQTGEVLLALETVEIAPPPPTPIDIVENPPPKQIGGKGSKVSLVEAQKMSDTFIKQVSGNAKYTFDKEFLEAVQKKLADYISEGYFARASAFKEVINKEFVKEQGLEARLGFILAMSRSQFKLEKQGADEGLWRMTNDFATANSYNVSCETPSLSDQLQKCAAIVASNYLKALNSTVFEGDVIYEVAAFGKSPLEASQWKGTLPADRSNFWNVIKDAKQREEIVRFFAAGIVAEYPQKFGLKNDRPISELYQ